MTRCDSMKRTAADSHRPTRRLLVELVVSERIPVSVKDVTEPDTTSGDRLSTPTDGDAVGAVLTVAASVMSPRRFRSFASIKLHYIGVEDVTSTATTVSSRVT